MLHKNLERIQNIMKASEIRQKFKDYFVNYSHQVVSSSSLIPHGDNTILFTNAGMNQFKDIFTGRKESSRSRAVSCQKCMRVSGKHNDLENVGYTARHHTFFEMLGNFSFGDYFKKDAIKFGWEFLTEEMKLNVEKLWVTVYEEDQEAHDIWTAMNVLPPDRIVKLGKSENFWSMGETGPCGPCSEIHIDLGKEHGCQKPDCSIECGCDRYLEIWNLVFMEFIRSEDGSMAPLPAPSIDTGMGLERITAAVQGVKSNYHTDLFQPVIGKVEELSAKKYESDREVTASMNVIADHIRAFSFLVSDGIIPSNDGRGYVLKKITRRAIRYAKNIGIKSPFMDKLIPVVIDIMGEEYPELSKSQSFICELSRIEEEKFENTLATGLDLLEELCRKNKKAGNNVLSGEEVFKLYDTYGFPYDLTVDIARDYDLTVDFDGYNEALEKQRKMARSSWKGTAKGIEKIYQELADKLDCTFTGYENIRSENSEITALVKDGKEVSSLNSGEEGEAVLSSTPFYGESGGQVGDKGELSSDEATVEVWDTKIPVKGLIVHKVKILKGVIRAGDKITAKIDSKRRDRIKAHHTTTHLLHKALRAELGEHIKQAGSMVGPDRFRFDFSHYKILSKESINRIEQEINSAIRKNMKVRTEELPIEEAVNSGAVALFGENYGDTVRVVSINDYSKELCGGTHCDRTGEIGIFRIISEKSVASGIRRIEAVCGEQAYLLFKDDAENINSIAESLNCPVQKCTGKISEIIENNNFLQKELAQLKIRLAQSSGGSNDDVREVCGVKVISKRVEGLKMPEMRNLSDSLKNKLVSGVVILGSADNNKVTLTVAVTKDLTDRLDASIIIRDISAIIGGSGGGKKDMAQAGGKDASRLDEALQQGIKVIKSSLSG